MTFVLFLPQSNIDDLEVFREEKLSSGIIFLSLFLLFPNVFASSLPFSFSPGAGGCSNTRPPSFLLVDDRATSSTTDSSQAVSEMAVLTPFERVRRDPPVCTVSYQRL